MAFQFVAFLGDSITEGVGLSGTQQPWPALVADRRRGTNFAAANHSNSGEKIAAIATRYDNQVAGRGYTAVVFGPTTNDLPDGTTGAAIYAALLAKAQAAQAEGMTVVLCTTLPRKNGASYSVGLETERGNLNTLIRAATASDLPGAYVVDMDAATRDGTDPLILAAANNSGDSLHPSSGGHVAMADAFDAIMSALWPLAA